MRRAAKPIEDAERVAERGRIRTVGPDPMTLRSSPMTSEMASVRHAARDLAASHPPLIADACFRTVFKA